MNLDTNILTFKEAAAFLRVSERTLYEWTADNKIPYMRAGRLLRFDKDQLVSWLKGHNHNNN